MPASLPQTKTLCYHAGKSAQEKTTLITKQPALCQTSQGKGIERTNNVLFLLPLLLLAAQCSKSTAFVLPAKAGQDNSRRLLLRKEVQKPKGDK